MNCFSPSSPTTRCAEHFAISYFHLVEGETEVERWDRVKSNVECQEIYSILSVKTLSVKEVVKNC